MKNKIKEILECFSSPDINFSEMLFNRDERLLDYITNLQEENERLRKDYGRLMQDNAYTLELERRNEKAIEYNQQIIKDTKDFYRPTEDIIYSGDTLIDIAMNNINILQGGDN